MLRSFLMVPILTRYGNFFLYSFTVALTLGIAAGLAAAAWQARRRQIEGWMDTFLAGLAAGFVGGRAGFVWLAWDYFQQRPYEILQIWRGGLTYHGALLAGLAGGAGWCMWRRRSFVHDLELLAPALALMSAFGWLACWLSGCGCGREAPAGAVLAANLPDQLGIFAWRYQVQLLGVGLSLLVFGLALGWSRYFSRGQFYFVLLAVSVGRVGLGFWRGDTAVFLQNIRLDMLIDAALAILAAILLQYSRKMKTESAAANQ